MKRLFVGALFIGSMGATFAAPAYAQPAQPAAHAQPGASDDAATEGVKDQARARYTAGVELVKKAQWSEALAAFETSSNLYPNALTSVSIGSCERALGRYLKARDTLNRALAENDKSHLLPDSSVTEARGFIDEIDHVVVRVHVSITPTEAAVAIDGRPLKQLSPTSDGIVTLAANVLPPGKGQTAPAGKFDLLLDPGAHVIVVSRQGSSDVVVNRTFAPGSTSDLDLKLDLLPATLKITSPQKSALVRVDGKDVGPVPAEVLRPAGTYKVIVAKNGFVDYESTVSVKPGEEIKLKAPLVVYKPSVFTRWWFWSAAGAVITGGVLVTYFATRPAAVPPPYDAGSTNWVVKPAAFRF